MLKRALAVLALPLIHLHAPTPAAAQPTTNMLTYSGFIPKPANTPEKLAILHRLAPDRLLVRRRRDGKVYYVYADPNGCVCVYVGGPQAYKTYRLGGPGYQYQDTDPSGKPDIAQQVMEAAEDDGVDSDALDPSFNDYLLNDEW